MAITRNDVAQNCNYEPWVVASRVFTTCNYLVLHSGRVTLGPIVPLGVLQIASPRNTQITLSGPNDTVEIMLNDDFI